MHSKKRRRANKMNNKTIVFGAVEREGKVTTKIIPDVTKENLIDAVKGFVEQGATVVTDENNGYIDLKKDYKHLKVNHTAKRYVRGIAYTNTVEGFWNLLKKQIGGIHHKVSRKHLQRYCNEVVFRYNQKKQTQDERFNYAMTNLEGRLTYRELIK